MEAMHTELLGLNGQSVQMKAVVSDMGNRVDAKLDQALEALSKFTKSKWDKVVTANTQDWLTNSLNCGSHLREEKLINLDNVS